MNKQIVMLGVLVILLFSAIALGFGSINAKGNVKVNERGVKGYTQHDVIRVNNDTDFANQGWPGSGTQSNPYVISGYDIDAHGARDTIYIGNTTKYFVVENCYLHNASYGIEFYNVKNGKISDNNITNNEYEGIRTDHSSSNNISGNNIKNNSEHGIFLLVGDGNNISGNNITNNHRRGMELYGSNSNNISGNNIMNNGGYGIEVYSSSSNNISGNDITNNSYGIILDSSSGPSSSNKIYNNLISNNIDYGILMDSDSSYNLIYNNSFYYNHGSGDAYNSSHVQAYDYNSNNYWNTSGTPHGYGNYWHDWANNNDTNDNDNNGIVDWSYNLDGSGNDSYPLKNPTYLIPPLAPKNLQATAGDGFVNITWQKPLNGSKPITGYRIYRNGTHLADVSASQLYYNDTGVSNGFTYTYYVTAVNSVGESDKSNEVQATPGGAVPEFSTGIWLFIVVLIALLGVARFRKIS